MRFRTVIAVLGAFTAVVFGAAAGQAAVSTGPTVEYDGHHYAMVDAGEDLLWSQALAAADQLTFPVVESDGGVLVLEGHLATVTPAEYPTVIQVSGGWVKAWVGAQFDHDAGEWRWITGELLPASDPNWPPPPVSEQDDPLSDPVQDVLLLDFANGNSQWEGWWSWHNTLTQRRYIVEFEPPQLRIDIKPGSQTNPVNLRSRGVVPVAVLGTENLDVTRLDHSSVVFGPDEAPLHKGKADIVDVNGDGHLDLKLHFRVPASGIASDDTHVCVQATTLGGTTLRGCDTITIK